MDELDGRDVGRIKKEGFFSGTKAYGARLKFVGGVIFIATLMGGLRFLIGPGYLTDRLMELERNYKKHEDRVAEITAKRNEMIQKELHKKDF